MHVCIVGGIYGASPLTRNTMLRTPEILLERALQMRGHKVSTLDLNTPNPPPADIVHAHHFALGTVRLAAMRRRPPLVFTSHDGQALCGARDGMKRLVARQFVFSRAQAVVALSDAEYEFQAGKYSLDKSIHRVIPNGVEEALFPFRQRTRFQDMSRPWRLLFVGQLIPLKGVDTLLRAIARSTHSLELQLIYQNSYLKSHLQRLAAELGIARRVCFCGPVAYDRLSQYYRNADLLVLPSTAESLPSVVSEALLSGLPVVATSVGGIPWQLAENGVLCLPGNPDALCKAIDTAICHYPLLCERAEEASRMAGQRFSVESMVDAHIALYEVTLKSQCPQTSPWVDGLRALTAQLGA